MTEASTAPAPGPAGAASTIRTVHVVSWRDLRHPEHGGSERHVHEIMRRWAADGIDVTLRTGAVPGLPSEERRDGYRVVRGGGRFGVFLRTPLGERTSRGPEPDALLEIFHGLPFLAPLWSRVPLASLAHHVHGDQFDEVLPRPLAKVASAIEGRVAPRVYRRTPMITLSESAKRDLVQLLGYRPEQVSVVSPGVADHFSPGGTRSPVPLVVAVARLMPQKGVHELVDVLVELRRRHPSLEGVIVGSGPEQAALTARVADAGAASWLRLPGSVDEDALVDLYRRAWVLASASRKEGWGMTITEAAACGTPAVATRIAGHVDAVQEGRTGLLADDAAGLVRHLDEVLSDDALRARLGAEALRVARTRTWDETARQMLAVLSGAVASAAKP